MSDAQYNEHSNYPPHQKCVELGVEFGSTGTDGVSATIYGSDLPAEYVAVNADNRS
jgi:N-acetylglutamate synthase/N-acetylornithine aminotransferase